MKKDYFSLLCLSLLCFLHYSQSPIDLNANIGQDVIYWFNNVNTNTDVVTTFNNARRAEEIQLLLATNVLGNLTLPEDWDTLNNDQKALYLLNAERTARAGVNYGSGPVLGLPFEGLQDDIDALAQAHAEDQLANNTFSHTGSDNSSPFDRIDNDPTIGGSCSEFMTYSENIYGAWSLGGANTFVIENSVYTWLYEDAPSWGHRRAVLIQDTDVYGGTGFNNDSGDMNSEGYIGIGMVSSPTYNPNNFNGVTDGDMVVLKIFDPESSCQITLSVAQPELEIVREIPKLYPNPTNDTQVTIKGLFSGSSFQIFDMTGKVIQTVSDIQTSNYQLSISDIDDGHYFIVFTDKTRSFFMKFIKN